MIYNRDFTYIRENDCHKYNIKKIISLKPLWIPFKLTILILKNDIILKL